jgi:putative nucleotidyltransferase with HDIG domain
MQEVNREVLNRSLRGSPIRSLSDKSFELLLVTAVLIVTIAAHQFTGLPLLLLHFFYLPVIIAAHFFGRTVAGTTALFSVLAVGIFAIVDTPHYTAGITTPLVLGLTIAVWGGFLGLVAILVGTLCDQRAEHIRELRDAYMGIIEILSKYLQATDQYTKSHSIRVADLAESIARQMKLKDTEIENIRVGALLHDIGKVEISTRLIQKASSLNETEGAEMATHTVRGAELVRSLGSIVEGAIPVIMHHHDHYCASSKAEGRHGEDIPLGARVVSVADAYDAIVTDRPYRRGRTPVEAINIIREASGTQFDPKVVAAFERVMRDVENEDDGASTSSSQSGKKRRREMEEAIV